MAVIHLKYHSRGARAFANMNGLNDTHKQPSEAKVDFHGFVGFSACMKMTINIFNNRMKAIQCFSTRKKCFPDYTQREERSWGFA